ncbi:MAG: DUF4397 domain-containing protein [Chitinophagaceae bacterium]
MKSCNYFTFTIGKTVILFLCSGVLFSSCLKNKDSTGDGPKSQMAITNYVVNGASFNVLYDNTTITTAPLSFGNSISNGSGAYVPFSAGIHNFKLNSGTDLVADNSISLETGKNYSIFLYDTLKNNKVKSLMLTDDLVAVDTTVAKGRFLQFIPGADSLTLYLAKDTLLFAVRDTYIGNKSEPGSENTFFMILPPGSYQLQLQRNNTVIFQQASISMLRGKLYSFVCTGTINGTGVYKERVSVVQHN